MKRELFIAAGGKGVRLEEATAETAKSMVRVDGRPMIDHIIETAETAGVEGITVGLDNGKDELRAHLGNFAVSIQENCAEPLTKPFFETARRTRPDVIIGVNGDTLYHSDNFRRLNELLEAHPDAAAVVLMTNVMRPVLTSDWAYWSHRFKGDQLAAMDEIPGREMRVEYMMAAFRLGALDRISEGFTEEFGDRSALPFNTYSAGWDYLTRILLWKGEKVVGAVTDDLSININYPVDLADAQYFSSDPGYFRWLKSIPAGASEPVVIEQALAMIKPQAREKGLNGVLVEELTVSGLSIVRQQEVEFDRDSAEDWNMHIKDRPWFRQAVDLLCAGPSNVYLVEGRGGFYRALDWKARMRGRFAVDRTDNLVHSTFSRTSFERELTREQAIIDGLS